MGKAGFPPPSSWLILEVDTPMVGSNGRLLLNAEAFVFGGELVLVLLVTD